jgi:hypothetical protein
MDTVYRFLAAYEGLIYILLSLGGLFAFRWLWKSWREWRDSVFGLEREFAGRRMSQALMVSLLILFLFLGELFLASFVVPGLPVTEIKTTPTLEILNQPQSAFSSDPAVALTVMTPIANLMAGSATGCVPDEIILTSPEPGQQVSGVVTLLGTVDVDNFGFYKYEVAPQGADTWATISAGRSIIIDGEVGRWDTSTLTPGDYELRLEVTNNQGEPYPACTISVRVTAP